jgi:hypothetical protein
MESYSIHEYRLAGCKEMDFPSMMAVHGLTQGKVCDTGCHAYNGGKCPAYKRLISPNPHVPETMAHQETVRETAKRKGVSISQVRRWRKDGIY